MGNSNSNTSLFLTFLEYIHYFLLFTYFALLLGFHYFDKNGRDEYVKALNTIYTLGVGIVLVSIRFPILLSFKKRDCSPQLSSLMVSAGVIVLSTVRYEEVVHVWELARSHFV